MELNALHCVPWRTLYIAFTKADMERIQDVGSIDNAAFAGWIPLKETPGIAIHAAMRSPGLQSTKTELFVLEVSFDTNEVASRFLDKTLLHRKNELGAFYYAKPLRMIPGNCNWCWIQSNCKRCHASTGLAPAIAVNPFCTFCWHIMPQTMQIKEKMHDDPAA
jgi:hypothetical protein